ncbi:MAG: peptidase S8, partial [Olleya sp.]
MKINFKPIMFSAFATIVLSSCGGGAPILSTPTENIDNTPIKESALTEAEAQNWGHLDLVKDTIPGMSVDKAYAEIIKGKIGQQIIVAVIDSGIDITHQDLDGVIWTNQKEIAGNGKDDDGNGYVDDIHGWNFLGDAYDEQLEMTRIVASGNTADPRYAEAKTELEQSIANLDPTKQRYEQIYSALNEADAAFTAHFKTEDYTNKQVLDLQTTDEKLTGYKQLAAQMNGFGLDSIQTAQKILKGELEGFTERLNYNYNVD